MLSGMMTRRFLAGRDAEWRDSDLPLDASMRSTSLGLHRLPRYYLPYTDEPVVPTIALRDSGDDNAFRTPFVDAAIRKHATIISALWRLIYAVF